MISLLFLCFTIRLHRSDMIMSNFLEASGNSWKSTKSIVFISIDQKFEVDTNKLQNFFSGGVSILDLLYRRTTFFKKGEFSFTLTDLSVIIIKFNRRGSNNLDGGLAFFRVSFDMRRRPFLRLLRYSHNICFKIYFIAHVRKPN